MNRASGTQVRGRESQKRTPIDLEEELRNDRKRLVAIGTQLQGGLGRLVALDDRVMWEIRHIQDSFLGIRIGTALGSTLGPIFKERMREEGVSTMDELMHKILSRVPPEFGPRKASRRRIAVQS
jgi:aconitase B